MDSQPTTTELELTDAAFSVFLQDWCKTQLPVTSSRSSPDSPRSVLIKLPGTFFHKGQPSLSSNDQKNSQNHLIHVDNPALQTDQQKKNLNDQKPDNNSMNSDREGSHGTQSTDTPDNIARNKFNNISQFIIDNNEYNHSRDDLLKSVSHIDGSVNLTNNAVLNANFVQPQNRDTKAESVNKVDYDQLKYTNNQSLDLSIQSENRQSVNGDIPPNQHAESDQAENGGTQSKQPQNNFDEPDQSKNNPYQPQNPPDQAQNPLDQSKNPPDQSMNHDDSNKEYTMIDRDVYIMFDCVTEPDEYQLSESTDDESGNYTQFFQSVLRKTSDDTEGTTRKSKRRGRPKKSVTLTPKSKAKKAKVEEVATKLKKAKSKEVKTKKAKIMKSKQSSTMEKGLKVTVKLENTDDTHDTIPIEDNIKIKSDEEMKDAVISDIIDEDNAQVMEDNDQDEFEDDSQDIVTNEEKSTEKQSPAIIRKCRGGYKCEDCDKILIKHRWLVEHRITYHGKEHKCTNCDDITCESFAELEKHFKDKHSDKTIFNCPTCSKPFIDRRYMQSHQPIHKLQMPFACEDCGKTFRRRDGLMTHRSTHTGIYLYKCEKCPKKMATLNGLRSHMANVHPKQKLSICESCGKRFSCPSKLELHFRKHSGYKPYTCKYCPQTFAQLAGVQSHERLHTNYKPFICATCGKSFSQKAGLVGHERTHTGDRPYLCSYCDKTFASQEAFVIHERYHTGSRPYVCDVCGKQCISQGGLRDHKRIHSTVHAYVCSICQRTFSQSQGLRKHTERVHKDGHHCSKCGEVFGCKELLVEHREAAHLIVPRLCDVSLWYGMSQGQMSQGQMSQGQ